jgi:hypothetical protein
MLKSCFFNFSQFVIYMKIELINIITNKKEELNDDECIDALYYFTHKIPDENNEKIKIELSEIEGKIPLYDIYTSNLYLINPENLYYRITYNHYRFPTKKLLDSLQEEFKNKNKIGDIVEDRKIDKFNLMIKFLNNFNLNILESTFYRTMYKSSPELGKNLLFCKRPSFNKYIHNSKPYYSRIEVINMARNMGLKVDLRYLTDEIIEDLCLQVRKNDINQQILIEHQKYIIKSNLLGLIQYYTVQGSSNLNSYLRNPNFSKIKNETYNEIIKNLWTLCLNAPSFDNTYIIYRFIHDDSFLSDLKIGDEFQDKGFMSSTRDPFYKSDSYSFGFILLKIRIPKNIKGVGLCLEGCSHFPNEQEIIFPPLTRFKLLSRDSDIDYFHTDLNINTKIKTKYEFEWVSNEKPKLNFNKSDDNLKLIDFSGKPESKSLVLAERIKRFNSQSLSSTGRFLINVNNKEFTVIAENYNSLSAYKNFYGIKTESGYSLYCIYNNYLLFFIELGSVNNSDQLHVNYYVRYNTLNKEQIITNTEFITLLSEIGYYFSVDKIIIYSEYKPCFTFNKSNNDEIIGNYCEDFYLYLKENKKRFFDENIIEIELSTAFSYYDLDQLKQIKVENFFTKIDTELYQIYDKAYKLENNNSSIADYLIWIIENKCYLIDKFLEKLKSVYIKINPFKRDMYILNPYTFLYNRGKFNAYSNYYYETELDERDNILIRTDEYKRIMMANRDFVI